MVGKAEDMILAKAVDALKDPFVDVGAHIGSWCSAVAGRGREVYAIEAVEDNFDILEKTALPGCHCFHHVMGAIDGKRTQVCYDAHKPYAATAVGSEYLTSFHGCKEVETHDMYAVSGDAFCLYHRISKIGMLKIDCEGGDYHVLSGFHDMLHINPPSVIQFEYGQICIEAHVFLKDFYDLLTPLGYKIGLLDYYGVEFKDYDWADEDFLGPNYIAVHESEPDFIEEVRRENNKH